MRGRSRSVVRALGSAFLLAAAIPACRAIDAVEPKCEDSVPVQAAKALVWVPLSVACLAAELVVESEAEEYVDEHGEYGRAYEHGEPLRLQNDPWGDPR